MKIESLIPLKVKRPSGDIVLTPGTPVEFTEEEGLKLMVKAKGKVRLVEPPEPVIQPATKPDGSPLSPVYFERKDGFICGPAKVLDFMRASAGGPMRDWLVVEYQGLWEWVLSDRLRTRKQFETQKPLQEVELIREVR